MLAARPTADSSNVARAQAEEPFHEEKSIQGVNGDALREERRPLLDLDDVEQLESELAACFDAPPPPPLVVRQEEPTATLSSWTASSEPRYMETRYVAPPTESTSEAPPRSEERQHEEQKAQATRVSDFSSLYSPAPQIAVSSGQLYPALIPTAPSTEAMRTQSGGGGRAREASAVVQADVQRSGNGVAAAAKAAAAASAASVTAASARDKTGAAAAATAGESSGEVVEELLSENERLRSIIQDMSEELERMSNQLQGGATAIEVPPQLDTAPGETGTQTRTPARESSATASTAQLTRYPGARAEAARRQREQEAQGEQQQVQPGQEQSVGRGAFVHFKCENCPQWLRVPGHAQLVFCPTCSHTSHMTSSSIIHHPSTGETTGGAGDSAAASSTGEAQEDDGWFDYFKKILSS